MNPPPTLTIGPYRYKVTVGGKTHDAARLKTGDQDLYGYHDPAALTISVRAGMAHDAECETVLHEVLHACFNVSGQPTVTADDGEEQVVRAVSGPLLGVLRSNPEFVRWLGATPSAP